MKNTEKYKKENLKKTHYLSKTTDGIFVNNLSHFCSE